MTVQPAASTGTPVGKGTRIMSEAQRERMFALEERVMALRTTGKSFHAINKEIGIQNSHQVFKRAMDRDANIEFRRAEALRMEEARLDALQEGIWGRALSGDARAVEVALKVLERRARLLGLDFADMISGKLVEVEQAKVALVAAAFGETLRDMGFSQADADRGVGLLMSKLRAGPVAPQQEPASTAVVVGSVVPQADLDLL